MAQSSEGTSPRHASALGHTHEVEEEMEPKRQRMADTKKQRINAITSQNANMIRSVKSGNEEYFTKDEYEQDVNQESVGEDDADLWTGEEEILVAGVPEALSSDTSLDETPPTPERWVFDWLTKLRSADFLTWVC